MNNGKEMLNEMEFERRMKRMDDRELLEFNARQGFETHKKVCVMNVTVGKNKTRSVINRIALIALIVILITLGVIDVSSLHLFGL